MERRTRWCHGSNAISDVVQPTTFVIGKLEGDALNELQTIAKNLHRSGDDEQLTLEAITNYKDALRIIL